MEEDTENITVNGDVQNLKRKRRYSSNEAKKEDNDNENDDNAPENKYYKLVDGLGPFRLLDFSDEMLYEIFQYLDSWTLMALMNCCTRLSSFVLDHRFWNFIDLSKEPLPLGILEDVLERSHANTVSMKLRGPPIAQHLEREDKQFNQTLAKVFSTCCTNLSVLELEGITIDFRYVRITDFPPTLKRLLLNDCDVRFEGEKSIFYGIEVHLTKLEELAIENSNWFEPYYMMVFSKVPELRSLSLKGCQLLSDFVPYGSMAARFGFKKLEFLDLRFTPIGDSDLQCFNAVATLKEVLLDCPESLRENIEDDVQKSTVKIENSRCPFLQNQNVSSSPSIHNESSPSTSSAAAAAASASSQLRVIVSLAPNCSPNSANNNETTSSTSAAATAENSTENVAGSSTSSTSSLTLTNSQTPSTQYATLHVQQRDDEFSLSSCSSSPSASSTSSNESLPPLLANPPRPNNMELPTPGGNAPPFSRFLPRPDQIILLDLNNRWRHSVMHNSIANRDNRAEQQLQDQQPQQQQEAVPPQQPQPQRYQYDAINNNNNNNNNIVENNGNHINGNQIEQVLSHPLFWDMINPFARVGPGVRRPGRDVMDESFGTPRRFDCRRSQCAGQYHQYHRHRHRLHPNPISDRGICCFGRPRNPVEHGVIWIRIGNRPSENRFERLSIRNYRMVTDISLQHLVQCSPFLVYLDLSGTSVTQRGVDTFKENKPECTIRADHLYETTEKHKN